MKHSKWCNISRLVIQQLISENPGCTVDEMRKLVSEAYPFGQRAMHPYKVWLSTVREILGPSPKALKAQRANDDQHPLDL